MESTTMFPPCVRDVRKGQRVRTVVAKIQAPNAAVIEWINSTVLAGRDAEAAAIVQLECDTDTNMFHVVITRTKADTVQHISDALSKRLEAPPLSASIVWIRAFDRRLQRLFDWGDVWAPREYLERLVEEDNSAELKRCFPALANTIAAGNLQLLPVLMESKPLLCLEDASGHETRAQELTRIQHELNSSHCFGEPNRNWQCSLCTEFGAARCSCGAQRCRHHQALPTGPQHRTVWKQSKFTPGPFYVQDPTHMRKEQKVEFIGDELCPDATLQEFAAVYIELFAEKICVKWQRQFCLELYGLFNPAFKPKKECELSPVELQRFQKVFDPNAPPRCHWCNAQIPLKMGQVYCNQACAEAANPPSKCQKCGGESFRLMETPGHCKGRINGMSRCNGCGHTEYCQLVTGAHWGTKRSGPEPQHWSKRRRS